MNILYLWVGAACPAWWLGSLRTSWCALLHIFNRRSGFGSAFVILTLQCMLQLPPPFNYASSHAILGLNRLFREAPWTQRPSEWTWLEATTHTLPALGHGIESFVFVAACMDTAFQVYRYLGAELTMLLLFLVYYPPNVLSRLGVRDLRGPSAPAAGAAVGASKLTIVGQAAESRGAGRMRVEGDALSSTRRRLAKSPARKR